MLVIALRFPSGRYHATPWDHHVNEGQVEWPPSPWRLLRALVATWHNKATQDVAHGEVVRLVTQLAQDLPEYALPGAAGSHTRHYVPLYRPDETTKVFDTFLHLAEDSQVWVRWPALTLDAALLNALRVLLSRLGYLGRAESWVEARVVDDKVVADAAPAAFDVRPLPEDQPLRPNQELVRVLVPLPEPALLTWRASALEAMAQQLLHEKRSKAAAKSASAADGVRLTKADKTKVERQLPATLWDALCCDTSDLIKQGWSGVPGARWVNYVRPSVGPAGAPRLPRGPTPARPTVARYAVACQAPPRLTEAVFVAERMREALMSRSDAASVFAGKTADGRPMRGHSHAYVLPEANGAHGHVTHVTLYAPMGFDDNARRALERVGRLRRRGHDLQLALLGVGSLDEFGVSGDPGQYPLLAESATWISRTPFVATRHPHRTRSGRPRVDPQGQAIGSPEHDLRRLLKAQGLPEPVHVEPISGTQFGDQHVRWLAFKTRRNKGAGHRASAHGVGFRLTFDRPVRGPIAVGYGAHFGLGTFVPKASAALPP